MPWRAFIMAGGSGERFWPLSRRSRPKQLLRLTHPSQTLLEEAVRRVEPLVGAEGAYVITGRHLHAPIEAAGVVPAGHVWAEPLKRNTLGALCWVAARLLAYGDRDSTLAILTADHKIADPEAFRATVAVALRAAEATGGLVTCGISPTRPETGYGYIEVDRSAPTDGAWRSLGFREKPDAPTAQEFLSSGRFLWNSGMFFWTLEAFLRELKAAQPSAHAATEAIANALRSGDEGRAEQEFAGLPDISIDFALMERAERVFVVEAGFGWDDVGAWDALTRSLENDARGNVASGEVLLVDTGGSVAVNERDGALLALVGVEGLVVVQTEDATLVCPAEQSQRVKEIVDRLKAERPDLL